MLMFTDKERQDMANRLSEMYRDVCSNDEEIKVLRGKIAFLEGKKERLHQ